MSNERLNWDDWFIREASRAAERSKDPRRQVGAVIVRPDNTEVSRGYNGFPRGIEDTDERLNDQTFKSAVMIHAEENAILRTTESLEGCTIYVSSYQPCAHCAGIIISKGIKRIVTDMVGEPTEKWKANFAISRSILEEAGVQLDFMHLDEEKGTDEFDYSFDVPYANQPHFALVSETFSEDNDMIVCQHICIDAAGHEQFKIVASTLMYGSWAVNRFGHYDQESGNAYIDASNGATDTDCRRVGYFDVNWRGSLNSTRSALDVISNIIKFNRQTDYPTDCI